MAQPIQQPTHTKQPEKVKCFSETESVLHGEFDIDIHNHSEMKEQSDAQTDDKLDAHKLREMNEQLDAQTDDKLDAHKLREMNEQLDAQTDDKLDAHKLREMNEQLDAQTDDKLDAHKLREMNEQLDAQTDDKLDAHKLREMNEQLDAQTDDKLDAHKLREMIEQLDAQTDDKLDAHKLREMNEQLDAQTDDKLDAHKLREMNEQLDAQTDDKLDAHKLREMNEQLDANVENQGDVREELIVLTFNQCKIFNKIHKIEKNQQKIVKNQQKIVKNQQEIAKDLHRIEKGQQETSEKLDLLLSLSITQQQQDQPQHNVVSNGVRTWFGTVATGVQERVKEQAMDKAVELLVNGFDALAHNVLPKKKWSETTGYGRSPRVIRRRLTDWRGPFGPPQSTACGARQTSSSVSPHYLLHLRMLPFVKLENSQSLSLLLMAQHIHCSTQKNAPIKADVFPRRILLAITNWTVPCTFRKLMAKAGDKALDIVGE
ncbi:hypothetical protein niasHT_029687 [Heterodera trifolii]|uniref:Uncharacterized protein n=2 Tax=Heterodera trifolii TaxID=157864 RepID=A0ABD2KTC0_9BILA